MAEWDRFRGEPSLWYQRFRMYLSLGIDRTVVATYRQDRQRRNIHDADQVRSVPTSWAKAVHRYNWMERAALYDDDLRDKATAREMKLREEDRDFRLVMLRAYRGRVIRAINQLDPSTASFKDVNAALAMLNREIRIEYGESTGTNRTEISGPNGAPIPHAIENVWADLDAPILTDVERRAASELARARIEETQRRGDSADAGAEDDTEDTARNTA